MEKLEKRKIQLKNDSKVQEKETYQLFKEKSKSMYEMSTFKGER